MATRRAISPVPRWGTSVNRLPVVEGRSADPADPTEVVVGVQTAADRDVEVGDDLLATVDPRDPELEALPGRGQPGHGLVPREGGRGGRDRVVEDRWVERIE